MVDRKDLILPKRVRLSRRKATAFIAGAALALATTTEVQATLSVDDPDALTSEKPSPPAYIPALNPRDRLKNTIDRFSDRQLTPIEAHDVFNQQADWNASSSEQVVDPAVFKRFYVLTNGSETTVKPKFNPNADPTQNPVVLSFFERYPDYPYTPENAKRILTVYNSGALGGTPIEVHQESFIMLDPINNPETFVPQRNKDYAYEGDFSNPAQSAVVPAKVLISTGQHEGVHQTYWGKKSALDPEIANYLKNYDTQNSDRIVRGYHDNFSVTHTVSNPDGRTVLASYGFKFNEFSTDFTSSSTLSRDQLPYVPGYDISPKYYDNFQKILDQSGVNFSNFVYLYDNGLLKELYQAIALGAEKDGRKLFSPSDKPEHLTAFGIGLLPWWSLPEWKANPIIKRPDIKEFFRDLAA